MDILPASISFWITSGNPSLALRNSGDWERSKSVEKVGPRRGHSSEGENVWVAVVRESRASDGRIDQCILLLLWYGNER